MITRKRLALFAGAIAMLFIAGEILGRVFANTAVEFMLQDKKLHCLEADGFTIGLCPRTNLRLRHPRGFQYKISTNARGERRASELLASPGRGKPIWVLGDSIAMGFGVDDTRNFPYLLAAHTGRPTANLGVDGLGARAILMRFRRAVRERERPIIALRIIHPSDFADDERDELYAAAPARAALFRGHFLMARWSAIYNWIRWFAKYRHVRPAPPRAKDKPAPGSPPPAPGITPTPADLRHPTFRYTEILMREARREKIPLLFVVYPAWDGGTGLPRGDYADLRGLPAFIQSKGGRVRDLSRAFHDAADPGALYIPGDGHPSAEAARIFLKELAPFVSD